MLILIGMILLFLIITGRCKDWWCEAMVLMVFFRVSFFIDLAIIIITLSFYPFKVDEKINMYTEENTNIELKVKETVRAYMNYEQETYTNLIESSDLTTLILKYPELNSNELIKVEIETYKENNAKIKELKEQKINKSIQNWWLYFGD